MSNSWSAGSTRRHRTMRAAVLARDGYRCKAHPTHCIAGGAKPHECTGAAPLRGGPGVAGHVHHLDGKKNGDDPSRCVAACPACNLAIGDPTRSPDPDPRPRTRWD